MNPATTVGRHQLSPRFTALVRTAYIGYPPVAQLQTVYGSMLEQVLRKVIVGLPHPSAAALALAIGRQQEPPSCADLISALVLMQAVARAVRESPSPRCLCGASTTTEMRLCEAPSAAEADM